MIDVDVLARAIRAAFAHPQSSAGLDWGIELYGSPNELARDIRTEYDRIVADRTERVADAEGSPLP